MSTNTMPNYPELLQARQETAEIDFKVKLDLNSRAELCEVIKDIAAMANSGGGLLLIGVNDDGTPANVDVSGVLSFDPANLTNKLFSFTGKHLDNFSIYPSERDGAEIAVIQVNRVSFPIVFTSPGTYTVENNKQKTAFSVGVVYFRHGAKSEPGTSDDLVDFIKREVDDIKDYWLSGIRKVIEAPEGSQIMVLPAGSVASQSTDATGFRVTDDPNAPVMRVQEDDIFRNYPYDYRSLTEALKQKYSDFVENKHYHAFRKSLERNPKYCNMRLLNPKKPNSTKVCFYSRAIFFEFDKQYTKRVPEPINDNLSTEAG
jgi:hypothetical protein